ncbi:MAG: alpha-amylase family glycosyl hydrolase [Archangium sp.]|nr:alpha-amylase family glycosyl hydrolase [Archangium sp.]MDP3152528.1 alpha-amylase family glycosyl hydrolase [Archangium sp.]MDP3572302.1 alpha-amylase family glycosyl hydrolase [Archangium sp.]
MRRLSPVLLVLLSCGPTDTARLYKTSANAASLDPAAIERLEHLGPTVVDKGINFGVYSERAERIEILLFDNPEAPLPTRQFPLTRFGDVWNIHIEGIGIGQHYGFVAWGPNWTYDPEWIPGSIKGFKADVDTDGNRFNPNKLLWDPYSKAIHRDHDWAKGSLATGPKRAESTWAAASKSIVVQSKYTWSENESVYRTRRTDENTPGHRWNDAIIYELHPKGFTASAASGVDHPGTWRGLGEKVAYLKELGVTAVELMPPFEKPSEGGYWGYSTLSFFIPENTYSFRKDQQEIIDEFKWMVDQFHQADIEVILDVVYNHTGEGGFWRERLEFDFNPDPSITPQLTNFDPKEVVGLYNFRGFDNHAYYALSADKQTFWNNTGVGNETRCNHKPFRKHIVDSLRYWVEEMHVDGFRFDLTPVLGEKDLDYVVWDDPKNTVLQDIIDDPLLQKYNTRVMSEPWAAGGYDLSRSFNGPGNNELSNGYGTRIGLFPAATNKPGTGWGEWNGRFRDWWRAFQNNDGFKLNSTEVKDGGFFLTGSSNWYEWNTRKPYHSVNFVTVHDGFTMYDLFSYDQKQNGCGPLNQICCTEPTSAWCEKVSGEDNNRSRNWNDEPMKRQLMRNLFVALMISQGTPLLWAGDEWMRTQLGNNNAYSTLADNSYNWMDWGTWQAQDPRHRMHDFVKQVIAFRKSHQYAFAPLEYGQAAPFSWKNAQNNPADGTTWNGKNLMMHFYDPSKGPELAILINGEAGDVTFTLPQGRSWRRLIDTQSYFDLPETLVMQNKPQRASNNIWLSSPEPITTTGYTAKPRTVTVLEASN